MKIIIDYKIALDRLAERNQADVNRNGVTSRSREMDGIIQTLCDYFNHCESTLDLITSRALKYKSMLKIFGITEGYIKDLEKFPLELLEAEIRTRQLGGLAVEIQSDGLKVVETPAADFPDISIYLNETRARCVTREDWADTLKQMVQAYSMFSEFNAEILTEHLEITWPELNSYFCELKHRPKDLERILNEVETDYYAGKITPHQDSARGNQ
jgi:hypothetical protein